MSVTDPAYKQAQRALNRQATDHLHEVMRTPARELSAASEIATMMHGLTKPMPRFGSDKLIPIAEELAAENLAASRSVLDDPKQVSVSHWGMFSN